MVGFSFTSCDDGSGTGSGSDSALVNISGQAWVASMYGYRMGYIFSVNGTFSGVEETLPSYWEIETSGTYTTSGNKLTITIHNDYDDKDNTQTVNYSVSGNTLTMTFSDGSISQTLTLTKTNINIGVFTPPSSHTPLTQGQWKNGSIDTAGGYQYYSFPVTAGTTYNVWSNGEYSGDGTKTLDIRVIAIHSNGTRLFQNYSGWYYPESFTASANGIVYLYVTAESSSDTGTFAIVYSANEERPEL
jgi:hypothetical protein